MRFHSIRITYIKQRKNKRYLFFGSKKNIDWFLKLQNLCHAYFTVKKAS